MNHANMSALTKKEMCCLQYFGQRHPPKDPHLYKPTKYSGRTVLAPAALMRRGSGRAMFLLVSSSTSSPIGLTTVHISNRSFPISWVARKSYGERGRWRKRKMWHFCTNNWANWRILRQINNSDFETSPRTLQHASYPEEISSSLYSTALLQCSNHRHECMMNHIIRNRALCTHG